MDNDGRLDVLINNNGDAPLLLHNRAGQGNHWVGLQLQGTTCNRDAIGARLSYVWRKEFLQRNEAALFANPIGVWRRPDKSLDFQLTAKLTDDLGLTFDATNLTKAKQQEYYRFDSAGNQDQFNLGTLLIPRTFAIGVRYTFD